MKSTYNPLLLPLSPDMIDSLYFYDELIDASAQMAVYATKIQDSKLSSNWFMPTLQQKEALASSMLEGTQATLDGVLTNQVTASTKDKNLNEVANYYMATKVGYESLRDNQFSNEFFQKIHKALMEGNVRKPTLIGTYRNTQNFIGKNDPSHAITFVPPSPDKVQKLMNNLIGYMNLTSGTFKPLVNAAIIHAQFETIHPFMDGNGRVGRILIPMYLYAMKQIELPYFFISEALERDKLRYYNLLNATREKNDWNAWIKFFLIAVAKQCKKYIQIVNDINGLYEKHLSIACNNSKSSTAVAVVNALYKHPVVNIKMIEQETGLSRTAVVRVLNILMDNNIIYSDEKSRNRTYYYYDLLSILRE